MRISLAVFGLLAAVAAPSFAQSLPAPTPPSPPAASIPPRPVAEVVPAPKPAMIKKTVCRRVDDEESTGSRLGSAPKVCKVIMVPAPNGERGQR